MFVVFKTRYLINFQANHCRNRKDVLYLAREVITSIKVVCNWRSTATVSRVSPSQLVTSTYDQGVPPYHRLSIHTHICVSLRAYDQGVYYLSLSCDTQQYVITSQHRQLTLHGGLGCYHMAGWRCAALLVNTCMHHNITCARNDLAKLIVILESTQNPYFRNIEIF